MLGPADEVELTNPIAGKTFRAKPAPRVLQWSFTDSSYTIVTTIDGEVIGTSHGWYELFMNLNESPPAWTGMRGGFEHGSYLRDEVWIDTNDGLPFRGSFQRGHGNIEIDGDTYYEILPP